MTFTILNIVFHKDLLNTKFCVNQLNRMFVKESGIFNNILN